MQTYFVNFNYWFKYVHVIAFTLALDSPLDSGPLEENVEVDTVLYNGIEETASSTLL